METSRPLSHILARIVLAKRVELQTCRLTVPQPELERQIRPRPRGVFRRALADAGASGAIIAEIKHASPSAGILRQDYDPAALACAYERAGASALSVLTDREFFQGSLEHLKQARAATSLPVLRKDFTLDEYHLYEAAAAGADAVLLIAAILAPALLKQLLEQSRKLGLDALVEVHTREELRTALDAGSEIIGVNNRDLNTFAVSLETSLELIDSIPDQAVAVSESGLKTAEEMERLRAAGFDAFLIGERFMREPDPGSALAALLADVAKARPAVRR
ncbi:MAG: indole-3-glycerol phosphate synthase TrpC [Acidobacteria bacterium]|nr:indole-3-glycerol phosphate synthase TrpC [Acidobacteriota bacterium]